mgnify:CR=1 FL=1
MVFDVPNTQDTYMKRYDQLGTHYISSPQHLLNYHHIKVNHSRLKQLPFLEIAPREVCTGTDHFEKFFQDVIDKGGEGVILRDPNEAFTPGRARGYLKHKVTIGRDIVTQCNSFFPNRNLGTAKPSFLPQWEMASGSASCKYITPLPLPPSLSILTHAHLQAKWDHLHCRSRNNRICQAMESYHRGCRNLQA